MVCCCNYSNSVFSIPVNDEEDSLSLDYTKFNKNELKTAADGYFNSAINESDETKKNQLLKNATTRYYILTNIEKDNPENYIALGRIYDMRGLDKYAKAYFYNALGLNTKNPNANFYFAEFYYKREKYKQALEYYKKALSYGYKGDSSEMLKRMGYMYEQYGDLDRAVMYYKNSVSMKPDSELSKKIQNIDGSNYSSTGYGKKRLRN
jgi:tetratricopeptide (TPR) repeat protein